MTKFQQILVFILWWSCAINYKNQINGYLKRKYPSRLLSFCKRQLFTNYLFHLTELKSCVCVGEKYRLPLTRKRGNLVEIVLEVNQVVRDDYLSKTRSNLWEVKMLIKMYGPDKLWQVIWGWYHSKITYDRLYFMNFKYGGIGR